MRTKAGIFALAGETLSIGAIMWTVAATLLLKDAEKPIQGMAFTLILTAACLCVYLIMLRKEIRIPVLAAGSAALFAGNIAAYLISYKGEIFVGFVLAIILVSAITVFVPLYYCIREQPLTKHLIFIDAMLLTLIWLFLFYPVTNMEKLSLALAVIVTLADVGGAICLRMSEGGMNEGVGKAFALSMGAAAVTAGAVFFLVKLFSRSSHVTETVLSGIRAFFLKLWEIFSAFADWIARLIGPQETQEMIPDAAMEMGSLEEEAVLSETYMSPVPFLVILAAAAVILAVFLIHRFRKNRMALHVGNYGAVKVVRQKKKKKTVPLWKKWADKLIFIKNAVLYRNTPRGLLVWLERSAQRNKAPRGRGESVREFLFRISPDGTLSVLADELDAAFYGGKTGGLSSGDCRKIRKDFRIRQRKGVWNKGE